MERLTIGQAAKRSGLDARTIRYYEEVGVLPRPRRTRVLSGNGYRLYTERDVTMLRTVAQARALGLPLRDIKRIARVVGRG